MKGRCFGALVNLQPIDGWVRGFNPEHHETCERAWEALIDVIFSVTF